MKDHTQFTELVSIIDHLLGPEGCPWDKKQTIRTLRHSVLEETCELIDAIEEEQAEQMADELGDLLLNVVLLAKVAAKEGHFTLEDALEKINKKLIYRHPHVFGTGQKLTGDQEVLAQWEELKKKEKIPGARKSRLDGIPKSLPSLQRAQKMISKMVKAHYTPQEEEVEALPTTEKALGEKLFQLLQHAQKQGLHAELALRRTCTLKEKAFRTWEKSCLNG